MHGKAVASKVASVVVVVGVLAVGPAEALASHTDSPPHCTSVGRQHTCVYPFIGWTLDPADPGAHFPLQPFTTPAGVSRLDLQLRGGTGMSVNPGGFGGRAYMMKPSFRTQPGDSYEVFVGGGGGLGGFGGTLQGLLDGGEGGRGASGNNFARDFAGGGGAGGGSTSFVKVVGEGDAGTRIRLAIAGGGGGAGGGLGMECRTSSACLVDIGGDGGAGGFLGEAGDGKPGKLSNPWEADAITPPEGGKHGSEDESGNLVVGAGGAGFDCDGAAAPSVTGGVGSLYTDSEVFGWRAAVGGVGAPGGLNGGGGGGGGLISGAGGGAGVGQCLTSQGPWTGGAGGAGGISGIAVLDRIAGPVASVLGPSASNGTFVVSYEVAAGTPDSTPPTTTLLTKTLGIVTSPTVTARFEGFDDVDLDHFECRLDEGDWATCTSPASFTLADGGHKLEVRAVDKAGNADPTPDLVGWFADTHKPTITIEQASTQADPVAQSAYDRRQLFTFDVVVSESVRPRFLNQFEETYLVVDNADTGERFTLGGDPVQLDPFGWSFGPTAEPNHFRLTLRLLQPEPEGRVRFRFDAGAFVDDAENGSLASTSTDNVITIDGTPPNTTITAPSGPVGADGNAVFTGSDNLTGVARFECRVDGGEFATCESPAAVGALSEGEHTFEARAVDGVGLQDATPAKVTFMVDRTPPDTQITEAPPAQVASSQVQVKFDGSDASAGVAGFECRLDGGEYAACDSPKTLSALSETQHTFEVRAVDKAGNKDAHPAAVTFTVDLTPPQTTILSGPTGVFAAGNTTNDQTPTFTFGANEAGSSFACRVDSGPWAACTSPHTTTHLADGAHTFQVRAADAVGNVDATPATVTFTVKPNCSLLSLNLNLPIGPIGVCLFPYYQT